MTIKTAMAGREKKGNKLFLKGGRIAFPFLEAAQISVEHIKKRLKRSVIIVCAIALGIALLTHLLMINNIYAAYSDVGTKLEGYQFWLIIISLIVCGTGLINANLIAMYERYREIGTMKFLGALNQHIMKLFFVESVILGFMGGLFGFALGTLTALLASSMQLGVNTFWIIPLTYTLQCLGLVVSLSLLLSVVSTLYPALQAAKLDPVKALRYQI